MKMIFMKGQYLSFDALVATIIFILALSSLLNQWTYVSKYRQFEDRSLHMFALEFSTYFENEIKNKDNIEDITIRDVVNKINNTVMPIPSNLGIMVIANDSSSVRKADINYMNSNISTSVRRSIYMTKKIDNKFVTFDIYFSVNN